jgi:predicted transcriptional regulator
MKILVAPEGLVAVSPHSMKGHQVRAARELLGLGQKELARAAEISVPTLRDIEQGTGDPRRSSVDAVEIYLAARGIKFTNEIGVIGLSPEPGQK